MTQTKQAQVILERVLSCGQFNRAETKKKSTDSHYLVIPGNNAPRWILPENSRYGADVLAEWQPYGNLSRIKWLVLRTLYRLQLLRFILGVTRIKIDSATTLKTPDSQVEVIPVIYVGTPGVQQKAVATLVDVGNCKPLQVMKVALAEGASDSLLSEAEILKQLAHTDVVNVPTLIHSDASQQRTWQSLLKGVPSSRKLCTEHISWQLQLPKSTDFTTLDEQAQIVNGQVLGSDILYQSENKELLRNAIDRIKGQIKIPLVLKHGDFAPWNIKQQKDQKLLVLDWEDAKFDALPLSDLCHFHFIQAHLFNEESIIATFIASPLIKRYLIALGLDDTNKTALILLYLVQMILDNTNNTNQEYKAFLMTQIPMVLAE